MNAGEVPNLFPADEKAAIVDEVRGRAEEEGRLGDGSPTTLFAYFVDQCQQYLHICLAMSPIGEAFRPLHGCSAALQAAAGVARRPAPARSSRQEPPSATPEELLERGAITAAEYRRMLASLPEQQERAEARAEAFRGAFRKVRTWWVPEDRYRIPPNALYEKN